MLNTHEIYQLVLDLEQRRENLQKYILDVNERQIFEAPKEDRAELFKTHDAILNFINFQTDVINILTNNLVQSYSKAYVKDLQNTITKQSFYIKQLGGNPSNLNFVTLKDLN
jgi:hypothetical protein